MKKIYYLALFILFFSCEKKEEIELVQLGAAEKNYLVEADGGNVSIPVFSNGTYHIERLTPESDWLRLTMPDNLSENGYIKAECDFNRSFRRQVVFLLCSDVDSRKDTITFRQKGILAATLSMDNLAVQARGTGGDSTYVINTNIPFDMMETSIS